MISGPSTQLSLPSQPHTLIYYFETTESLIMDADDDPASIWWQWCRRRCAVDCQWWPWSGDTPRAILLPLLNQTVLAPIYFLISYWSNSMLGHGCCPIVYWWWSRGVCRYWLLFLFNSIECFVRSLQCELHFTSGNRPNPKTMEFYLKLHLVITSYLSVCTYHTENKAFV